ncbi:hypothetical protein GE09DRAFT_256712 [Coniochaeta sp. 2T2.1]|nr:hypothetical protein GE09DRAFT_256712 [Coniochaeta sp. 2T2.1]
MKSKHSHIKSHTSYESPFSTVCTTRHIITLFSLFHAVFNIPYIGEADYRAPGFTGQIISQPTDPRRRTVWDAAHNRHCSHCLLPQVTRKRHGTEPANQQTWLDSITNPHRANQANITNGSLARPLTGFRTNPLTDALVARRTGSYVLLEMGACTCRLGQADPHASCVPSHAHPCIPTTIEHRANWKTRDMACSTRVDGHFRRT